MPEVKTAEEALSRALDWAEGRLSHTNTMQDAERHPDDRVATLELIEFADAQEVVKWSTIAVAMGHVQREETIT